jgi:hypothetical protein
MRKFLQWLLTKPIVWLNNTMASAPEEKLYLNH